MKEQIERWTEDGEEMVEIRAFAPRRFWIDGMDKDAWLDGFTDGTLWNGWECPVFELAEALKINAFAYEAGIVYDEATDTFFHTDNQYPEEPPLEYKGFDIYLGDSSPRRVYAVANMYWTWELADGEETYNPSETTIVDEGDRFVSLLWRGVAVDSCRTLDEALTRAEQNDYSDLAYHRLEDSRGII
jgi:hypothetical protein